MDRNDPNKRTADQKTLPQYSTHPTSPPCLLNHQETGQEPPVTVPTHNELVPDISLISLRTTIHLNTQLLTRKLKLNLNEIQQQILVVMKPKLQQLHSNLKRINNSGYGRRISQHEQRTTITYELNPVVSHHK
ncbi:hypothetical protein RvY_06235 [Ramazzottius varieornatus]|uniref:Uncharacterized protein n=1 Tax=Ramazzottius varieornatus TaxID=947166 RepID=A0A1D1UXV0_RAMVA|nr:hypothetical protein RvY_06235 [Ramazzottius varieornatus]